MKCLCLLILLTLPMSARAQSDDSAQARKHYERATAHYNLEEYQEAIREFEEAYRLRADPVILYNIAQAFRFTNNSERALHFYRAYLREQPNARNRAEVEQRITDLESKPKPRESKPLEAVAPAPTPVAPAPTATPPAPEPAAASSAPPELTVTASREIPRRSKVWIVGVVAVVVVGLAVGLGVGFGLPHDNPPPTAHFPNMKIF